MLVVLVLTWCSGRSDRSGVRPSPAGPGPSRPDTCAWKPAELLQLRPELEPGQLREEQPAHEVVVDLVEVPLLQY